MLWSVSVTLGEPTLERGIDAITGLVTSLVEGGITQAELDRAKETIIGSYLVRHDTSSNLAQTILVNYERGFPKSQLADYPGQISAVTLAQANEALSNYVRPGKISIAAAGTVREPTAALTNA
jgi:zinc protease